MSTSVNTRRIDGEDFTMRDGVRFASSIGKEPFEQVAPLADAILSASPVPTWRERLAGLRRRMSDMADAALVTMANYGPPASASFAGYNQQLQADAVERRLAREQTAVFGMHAGYGQQPGR